MDIPKEDILSHLHKAVAYIEKAIDEEKKVIFVHCREGKSRSGTIVAAYMMKKYKVDPDAAIEMVKKHRPVVKPNAGFYKQLWRFHDQIKGGEAGGGGKHHHQQHHVQHQHHHHEQKQQQHAAAGAEVTADPVGKPKPSRRLSN